MFLTLDAALDSLTTGRPHCDARREGDRGVAGAPVAEAGRGGAVGTLKNGVSSERLLQKQSRGSCWNCLQRQE
eukprot:361683-Chlamydomonas_euryale.AAC.1